MPKKEQPSGSSPDAGEGRLSPVTSLSLLERVRNNNADAWGRLFQLYRPFVLYWCGRWGVRNEDADDVSQEVFRAAAAGLAGFRHDRPGDTFRGWLRGITRHRVLKHLERARQHPLAAGGSDAHLRLQEISDHASDEEDPAEQISALYHRALDLVRSEFEERTWQAFWLTVVEARAPGTVAVEMGVTPAAVRQAKSRVLRRLKEEVGDLIA
jgi:RNA polymerase sigma-70 factor (ECF subfamily)